MAGFTTTTVERFIKAGVPAESLTRRLETGAGLSCGFCRRGRPLGSSSTGCAALAARAPQRPSRSARSRQLMCARRPRRPGGWLAKSPPGAILAPISARRSAASALDLSSALDDYEQWADKPPAAEGARRCCRHCAGA